MPPAEAPPLPSPLPSGPAVADRERSAKRRGSPAERRWAARIWIGMGLGSWLRMAARHRLAIDPFQWHTAAIMPLVGGMHSALGMIERAVYRRKLAEAPALQPPVFVIGHWRTGTTWLHELLALDERHTWPNTAECFSPEDFLLTEGILKRWRWLIPSRRPMDNMEVDFDRPQEDEFALAVLGQPSPYLTIAFPNRRDHDEAYYDLESLTPRRREAWKATLLRFLRRVAYRRPGRLVLKSPTHSFRIRTLLELFPEARFVHIVRDPRVVFASTVHLWKKLHEAQGLQRPRHEGLEERVYETFLHLYEKVEEGRRLVDPSHFHEVRYEDLVADPVGRMEALYGHLDLGGFEAVRPRLDAYLAERADYRTNRYEVPPEELAEIERRWGPVIRRYGYNRPGPAA